MKRAYLGAIPLLAILLCGCQANELEDRCFPLLTVVDHAEDQDQIELGLFFPTPTGENGKEAATEKQKAVTGDSFEEAWQLCAEELNKYADYNHMKVLLLGEDLLKQQEDYEEMLKFLQGKSSFPRNTYVCVVPDVWEFVDTEVLAQDPGSYLEEFLETQGKNGGKDLATLGKLIDFMENDRGEISIPKLEISEDKVVWEGSYTLVPVEYQEEFIEKQTKS
ncbi:MAG: hypothetical protein J6B26_03685 [Agathobacter sp.]|nr:hypothetical protein [Agathobacter sp.]MBQ2283046.1 hypothetical protein [Agathobacter sp.]